MIYFTIAEYEILLDKLNKLLFEIMESDIIISEKACREIITELTNKLYLNERLEKK